MAEYIISYIGGNQPASAEEGQKHFAQFKVWLSSLGEAVVSPANPLKNTHTIQSDGSVSEGSSTAMSGFTVVQADSIEQAVSMAQACPFLGIGGSLEVAELIKMPS